MANDYGFMGSPIGMMGAAILANEGNIGRGLLEGAQYGQQYRNNALMNQMAKIKLEEARRMQQMAQMRQQALGAPSRQIQPWETMGMAPIKGAPTFNVPQMNMSPGMEAGTGVFSPDAATAKAADRTLRLIDPKYLTGRLASEAGSRAAEMHPLKLRALRTQQNTASQPKVGDYKGTNIVLPDGGRVWGREAPDGTLQMQGDDGSWKRAPKGSQAVKFLGQGTMSELGLTKGQQGKEILGARDLEEGIKTGDVLLANLDKITTPFGASARTSVAGVVGALGDVTNADVLHDAADTISPPALEAFRQDAILWVRGQRDMIESGGRLTDQDAAALNEAFGVLQFAKSKRQMERAIKNVQEIQRRKLKSKILPGNQMEITIDRDANSYSREKARAMIKALKESN